VGPGGPLLQVWLVAGRRALPPLLAARLRQARPGFPPVGGEAIRPRRRRPRPAERPAQTLPRLRPHPGWDGGDQTLVAGGRGGWRQPCGDRRHYRLAEPDRGPDSPAGRRDVSDLGISAGSGGPQPRYAWACRCRCSLPKLSPGHSFTSPLRVRAEGPGRYELTSPNFSYRDHTGHARRETGFTAEIMVDPEPGPPPEPVITADLKTAELPLGEWSTLHSRIANAGGIDVSELMMTLSGHVDIEARSKTFTLAQLPAGASADAPFFVRAQEAGAQVPIHLDLSHSGPQRRHRSTTTGTVRVSNNPAATFRPAGEPYPLVRILFFGANPWGTPQLRVDEEIREIQQTIKQGRERDSISVRTEWAVRPRDITQALIDFQPHVVHFAGHGGGRREASPPKMISGMRM